jgi:hypothetical protein
MKTISGEALKKVRSFRDPTDKEVNTYLKANKGNIVFINTVCTSENRYVIVCTEEA